MSGSVGRSNDRPRDAPGVDLERRVGRVIVAGTWLAVTLVAVGVVLMAAAGRSPLAPAPVFDARTLPGDAAALRPEAFLWLGLVVAIATPIARVAASLVGYVQRGERAMAGISVAILAIIALSVALSLAFGREAG